VRGSWCAWKSEDALNEYMQHLSTKHEFFHCIVTLYTCVRYGAIRRKGIITISNSSIVRSNPPGTKTGHELHNKYRQYLGNQCFYKTRFVLDGKLV